MTSERLRLALVLVAGLVLAAIIHGGIYRTATLGGSHPRVYVVNKFTGSVRACVGVVCFTPTEELLEAPKPEAGR